MNEVTTDMIKQLIRENCMVRSDLEALGDDAPLFGQEGLGLDSLDALQITMAVEKRFGVVIADPVTARNALQSIRILRGWITQAMAVKSGVIAAASPGTTLPEAK